MQGIVYEEASGWLFIFVTIILGGGAAWMSGRAAALGWKNANTVVVYELALGIGVRFLHHAIFDGTFFSLHYYVMDTIVLLLLGGLGYRYTRTMQMVTQYSWLYERSGPFNWRARPGAVMAS
jgi:hypothetical protein